MGTPILFGDIIQVSSSPLSLPLSLTSYSASHQSLAVTCEIWEILNNYPRPTSKR